MDLWISVKTESLDSDVCVLKHVCIFIYTFMTRYAADVPPDFSTLLRQSSPTIPIIMIFDTEADIAVKLFTDFANRKQNRHVEIYLTDNGTGPEKVVRKQIQKGMAEVSCLFFHSLVSVFVIIFFHGVLRPQKPYGLLGMGRCLCCCWSLLYTAILCSGADSLHSCHMWF